MNIHPPTQAISCRRPVQGLGSTAACTVAEKYQAFYQMVVAWRDVVEQQNLKWVSGVAPVPWTVRGFRI